MDFHYPHMRSQTASPHGKAAIDLLLRSPVTYQQVYFHRQDFNIHVMATFLCVSFTSLVDISRTLLLFLLLGVVFLSGGSANFWFFHDISSTDTHTPTGDCL
jgi:hypothetical protein